jgi:integrase
MASVFVSHSSQDRAATERMAERLRAAGFAALFVDFDPERICPHSMRATFITKALDEGVPLRDVQDSVGHADPRTTRGYDRKPPPPQPPRHLQGRRGDGRRLHPRRRLTGMGHPRQHTPGSDSPIL